MANVLLQTFARHFDNKLYYATSMSEGIVVRDSRREDFDAIEELYPRAFPDENLLPLVRDLLADTVVTLSLVGLIEVRVVGHGIFTKCGIIGASVNAALLGPLAVAPERQRQGVGSTIVHSGLRRLEEAGAKQIFVLGDPDYYGRFGFLRESLVEPPFTLPAEWDGAWQSLHLDKTATPCAGQLSVPPPWQQPALWAP